MAVLDNLFTGRLENLAGLLPEVRFVQGDIRDRDLVHELSRGQDLVFHQAALTAVPLTVEDPRQSAEINDLGSLNVFLAARDGGVKRVVYASSSAVYGDHHPPPHHEAMPPEPNSPYAAHKLLGEHYAGLFKELYGLEIVCLRYFNVFGPRQDPASPYSGVISIFLDRLSQGLPPVIFGDGGQSRDFIYIDDVVRANFLAAEASGAAGQPFNIGTGLSVTLNEMLAALAQITGSWINPVYEPPRAGDIYASRAQMAKAAKYLGFKAEITFDQGLARTWTWHQTQASRQF